jgi:hypothetical protein
MTNPIVGAINGGIIGLLVGASVGFLNYPMFSKAYPMHMRRLYENNGAVLYMTAMGGGIGGCISGAINGFNSELIMNDNGVTGGLSGGIIGGLAGGTGTLLYDSIKTSNNP